MISLHHLIESGKYTEAKSLAEELAEGRRSSQWASTWYSRGLLCQTAYTESMRKNDQRLVELYKDQLYVAWESYEKALALDSGKNMRKKLAPKYVLLANDFQSSGVTHYSKKQYGEALRAFEQAVEIRQSPLLTIPTDTALLYNTALAAYENREWNKSIKYLNQLHEFNYSANATHLLFEANLRNGDTLAAEKALFEGIKMFDYNETLVLMLSDLLNNTNQLERAMGMLDEAITQKPLNSMFFYTKGLLYQKNGFYEDAISAYMSTYRIDPENIMAFINIATCYYNIGVRIEDYTRTLTKSNAVKQERAKSEAAFQNSVTWLDKAVEKKPADQQINEMIYELYTALRQTEKARMVEDRID